MNLNKKTCELTILNWDEIEDEKGLKIIKYLQHNECMIKPKMKEKLDLKKIRVPLIHFLCLGFLIYCIYIILPFFVICMDLLTSTIKEATINGMSLEFKFIFISITIYILVLLIQAFAKIFSKVADILIKNMR